MCVSVDSSVNPAGDKALPTHTHTLDTYTTLSSTMYVNYSMSWHNNIPIIIIILLSLLLIIDSEIVGHILHTQTRYC